MVFRHFGRLVVVTVDKVPDEPYLSEPKEVFLSGASCVCVSGQEGETDPLSRLELAHSQESVTRVGQPESARLDCLAIYLLPSLA